MALASRLLAAALLLVWAACAARGDGQYAVDDEEYETLLVRAEEGGEETWTPITATPVQPPCSAKTQDRLTRFSLFNIALQRRCHAQSGGVNAFPFDVAPSREQLVRLSTSPACLVVSKAVLRVVEYECNLIDMPLRATAETVLKLHEDRKDLATYPIPTEVALQQLIQDRAEMNRQRDADPIGFSVDAYPPELLQYDTQLAHAYAEGIVLLSDSLQVTSDLMGTEGSGSDAAAAAAAEIPQDCSSSREDLQEDATDPPVFGSSIDDNLPAVDQSEASTSDATDRNNDIQPVESPSTHSTNACIVATMIALLCAVWYI